MVDVKPHQLLNWETEWSLGLLGDSRVMAKLAEAERVCKAIVSFESFVLAGASDLGASADFVSFFDESCVTREVPSSEGACLSKFGAKTSPLSVSGHTGFHR